MSHKYKDKPYESAWYNFNIHTLISKHSTVNKYSYYSLIASLYLKHINIYMYTCKNIIVFEIKCMNIIIKFMYVYNLFF